MEEGFAPVLEEINSIVRKGYVMIGEKRVQVAMYFGGDYKVSINNNCNFSNNVKYSSSLCQWE